MCLDCVQQLDPPTPELAQGRLFLQLLAAGLFIVSLFAMLAGEAFTIFFMMILGLILLLSWSEFNYMMTLNFFLISVLQVIIVYVQLIKLVEYYDQISSESAGKVLYIIVKLLYYPNAVFFSHQAYIRFKQYAYNYAENQAFGDYQMLPFSNRNPSAHQYQGQRQEMQTNNSRTFMPFSGQAVTIG